MTDQPSACKVLVVDDDRDCAEELAELIACYDCETCIATSLETARAEYHGFSPDAVVLDLGLGSDSGLDLIRALRTSGTPQPHFILVSGRELSAAEVAELASAVPPLLLKPVDIDRLMQIILSL